MQRGRLASSPPRQRDHRRRGHRPCYVIVAVAMQTGALDYQALAVFAGLLAIVALAASFVYSRVITKNIETLYESASSISRGDLSRLVQFEVPGAR